MQPDLSLGEYVRRLRRRKRWGLQELADGSGLSVSHLSRIENDNAVPNAETVVKLATSLDGDLDLMLEMADCLPREILERYIRRAGGGNPALRRSVGEPAVDPGFSQALVDEMAHSCRGALARHFGLSDRDVDGLFDVLQRIGQMSPSQRETVISFLAQSTGKEPPEAG